MNKKLTGVILLLLIIMITGCVKYPELPDDEVAFEMGSFEDKENDEALYATLEYDGRTYIMYGTVNRAFKQSSIDKCIGYIVMDNNSTSSPDPDNTEIRVYTLAGDTDHNFLMDYDSVGIMNERVIWRAIDTKGKDIEIPAFIDGSVDYEFWK